jgi:hypothetical protein
MRRKIMKTNKIVAGALVALGFGGAVGLVGCNASRAQRSRQADPVPVADSVTVREGGSPVQVMYGPPPARFDRNRPVRERVLTDPAK